MPDKKKKKIIYIIPKCGECGEMFTEKNKCSSKQSPYCGKTGTAANICVECSQKERRPIIYSCQQCDKDIFTDSTDHTDPDLFKFEETAMEWDEYGSTFAFRRRRYLCVECRQGIPNTINFVKRKTDEMNDAQSWAFDKEWDMRGLRKRLKTYADMEKFADEYKKKQQKALLIQKEWNDFWIEKGYVFKKKFAIDNEDIIRSVNVNNEQYYRRLKLIQKNVRKIQSSF